MIEIDLPDETRQSLVRQLDELTDLMSKVAGAMKAVGAGTVLIERSLQLSHSAKVVHGWCLDLDPENHVPDVEPNNSNEAAGHE